jgi:hypothetical protein
MKNIVYIFSLFLCCLVLASAGSVSANYHNPESNKIIINGATCYTTEYEIHFYNIEGKELTNYEQRGRGDHGIWAKDVINYDFSNAVKDGAKSMLIECRPWDSGIYKWVSIWFDVTPTYWNILGSLGGLGGNRPRVDISWIDNGGIIRYESHNFP